MLKARTNHASTALNGEIYAIGGEVSLPVTMPLIPRATGPPPHPSLEMLLGRVLCLLGSVNPMQIVLRTPVWAIFGRQPLFSSPGGLRVPEPAGMITHTPETGTQTSTQHHWEVLRVNDPQ